MFGINDLFDRKSVQLEELFEAGGEGVYLQGLQYYVVFACYNGSLAKKKKREEEGPRPRWSQLGHSECRKGLKLPRGFYSDIFFETGPRYNGSRCHISLRSLKKRRKKNTITRGNRFFTLPKSIQCQNNIFF